LRSIFETRMEMRQLSTNDLSGLSQTHGKTRLIGFLNGFGMMNFQADLLIEWTQLTFMK